MKKFLMLALMLVLIFPLKVSAAIITIPNFEEIDVNVESLGAGVYLCHDQIGDIHVDEYVDLLTADGNFQWVDYYTNEYDQEVWLLKYIGAQKLRPLIRGSHIQILTYDDEYMVRFLLAEGIEMED